jgi:hypothetical protein
MWPFKKKQPPPYRHVTAQGKVILSGGKKGAEALIAWYDDALARTGREKTNKAFTIVWDEFPKSLRDDLIKRMPDRIIGPYIGKIAIDAILKLK